MSVGRAGVAGRPVGAAGVSTPDVSTPRARAPRPRQSPAQRVTAHGDDAVGLVSVKRANSGRAPTSFGVHVLKEGNVELFAQECRGRSGNDVSAEDDIRGGRYARPTAFALSREHRFGVKAESSAHTPDREGLLSIKCGSLGVRQRHHGRIQLLECRDHSMNEYLNAALGGREIGRDDEYAWPVAHAVARPYSGRATTQVPGPATGCGAVSAGEVRVHDPAQGGSVDEALRDDCSVADLIVKQGRQRAAQPVCAGNPKGGLR